MIVTPSPTASLKYLYGEAFRAPNAYELYYYGTTPPDLQPEFVRTHEVVWEQYVGEALRTSVSAYHYTASQLITFKALDSDTLHGTFGFANDGMIDADGLELEAEVRSKRGFQALASYVLQHASPAAADEALTNSPRHIAKARATFPMRARAFASAEWQFMSERATLAGSAVGAVSLLHLTAGWPIGSTLVLTGSMRNLFNQSTRTLAPTSTCLTRSRRTGGRCASVSDGRLGPVEMTRLSPRWVLARARDAGLAVAVIAGVPAPGVAQPIAASTLKAAFMLNFLKFTEWPAREPGLPIVACVSGSDSVAEAMVRTTSGQSIDGRAIQVTRIEANGAVRDCQLLFVGGREPRRLAAILEEAGRFAVLTVSDVEESSMNGLMVELFRENGRMRFAINIDTMGRSPVRISSRLLALAKIVRDTPTR